MRRRNLIKTLTTAGETLSLDLSFLDLVPLPSFGPVTGSETLSLDLSFGDLDGGGEYGGSEGGSEDDREELHCINICRCM
jgi:hypothetical protein